MLAGVVGVCVVGPVTVRADEGGLLGEGGLAVVPNCPESVGSEESSSPTESLQHGRSCRGRARS